MTAKAAAKLYSPALLGLATGLADYPFDPALQLVAETRSRSCGSVITIGVTMGEDNRITQIGMKVSACAIGQASAALLAQSSIGAAPQHIAATAQGLERWLSGAGDLPDWPGIAALAPARDHPGRHGALLLPWKAACEALSQAAT